MRNWKYINGAEGVKIGNSVPGAWKAYKAYGAKRAEQKEYNGYTLTVETYDDKDFGKYWDWYLSKGDHEIRRGETTSPSGAKAAAEIALLEELRRTGNSKVGNKDPRIASLKSKIKQNKNDIGALKDVLSLAEDMISNLRSRKEKLSAELESVNDDLWGWQELRTDVKFMI